MILYTCSKGSELLHLFLTVIRVDPFEPGDPRELMHSFEENYEQVTSSYMFTFCQESNSFSRHYPYVAA